MRAQALVGPVLPTTCASRLLALLVARLLPDGPSPLVSSEALRMLFTEAPGPPWAARPSTRSPSCTAAVTGGSVQPRQNLEERLAHPKSNKKN